MPSDVGTKVKEIVCEQLGVSEEEVAPDASFIEDRHSILRIDFAMNKGTTVNN